MSKEPNLIGLVTDCPICGEESRITVEELAWVAWRKGTLIQRAFPNFTAAEREQVKTGIHPECWPLEESE